MAKFNLSAYDTVDSRIHKFRNDWPDGRITTEIAYLEKDDKGNLSQVVVRAFVWRDRAYADPCATDMAEETFGNSTVNKSSFIENCYHPDTQILSEDGWVPMRECMEGDYVAAFDPDADEVRFVPVLATVARPGVTQWVRISDNLTDQLVTPDHRCLLADLNVRTAGGLRPAGWRLWGGHPHPRHNASRVLHGIPESKTTPAEARLAAWVQGDGHHDGRGGVKFGFTKPRKVARLVSLLVELEVEHSLYVNRRGVTCIDVSRSAQVPGWFKYPRVSDLLALSDDAFGALLDEIQYVDGSPSRGATAMSSIDHAWVEALATVAPLRGWHVSGLRYDVPRHSGYADGKPLSRIRFDRNPTRRSGFRWSQVETEPLTAVCVTVETGFVVTRLGADGPVTISGNCATSAIGRALATLGYSPSGARPSREEMEKVARRQAKEIEDFKSFIADATTRDELAALYGRTNNPDIRLLITQAANALTVKEESGGGSGPGA